MKLAPFLLWEQDSEGWWLFNWCHSLIMLWYWPCKGPKTPRDLQIISHRCLWYCFCCLPRNLRSRLYSIKKIKWRLQLWKPSSPLFRRLIRHLITLCPEKHQIGRVCACGHTRAHTHTHTHTIVFYLFFSFVLFFFFWDRASGSLVIMELIL